MNAPGHGEGPSAHETGPTPGDIERRARVDALNAEARSIRRLDYDRLLRLAEEAFDLASEVDSTHRQYPFGMANALSILAHRSVVLGDSDVALSQASRALGLLESQAPSEVLGDIYDSVGWAHYCLGDYVEALDHLMTALKIAEAIEDRSMQAYVMDSIANVHSSSGHPKEAMEVQERALAIHRELGDEMGEALVLNNTAYTCMDLGDPDTALTCAEAALRYTKGAGRPYMHVAVLDTLSEIHLRMGDLDAAEEYANRSLAIARERGSELDEADSLMKLGRIAHQRGSLDEALRVAERALGLNEQHHRPVEQYRGHALLSEILEDKGDTQAALAHYKHYHELERARFSGEAESRLANLRVEHQVQSARKDAEIHRLRNLALEREVEERRIAQALLEAQASLDPLTGLFNRAHVSVLAEELRMAVDRQRPVSLVLFDVDHFKAVNDTHGHLGGDRVLISIARALKENVRESDMPCRYGGDEFLVLLTGMDRRAAAAMAERMRAAISTTPVRHGDTRIAVTVSVGVTSAMPGEPADLEALIERADHALYAAKQTGRDRVVSNAPAVP